MSKILMVPVHLDALYLKKSEAAAEPTADFRNLPYYDSREGRDVNSDTPWIGDSVVTPPFENSNMMLQAGVHLHWSLPDGLCRGKVVNGEIEMPAVPNRWLIRRRAADNIPERHWVVESDYLWPPTVKAPAVNIFRYRPEKDEMPYRFLGRKLPWKEWADGEHASHAYLEKLTAIGHGEPTFAAYYPNCMTVFGFHDPDVVDRRPPETPPWKTVQYNLLGWYGGDTSSPELSWDPDAEDPSSMIEPLRRWRVGSNDEPQQLVCYASIKLTNGSSSDNSSADENRPKVAVGNTVTEALSALLADEVANEELGDPDLARTVEEQLEALHIEGQLASESQDLGLRLRRYRHQKSFAPVPGSERWSVHADPPGENRLSGNVLNALRDLNEVQARHGRRLHELEHARRQLYGDWCNYMRCVYRPPDGGRGQFLDIDEVVAYIENRSLEKVERLAGIVAVTGNHLEGAKKKLESLILQLNIDEIVTFIVSRDLEKVENLTWVDQVDAEEKLEAAKETLAACLRSREEAKAEKTEKAEKAGDNGMPERPTQYALRSVPGARFWQPTDPVVLIAGKNVQVNERHGRDGRNSADGMLRCETYDINEPGIEDAIRNAVTAAADDTATVLQWIDVQWKPSGCIGFREANVGQRPWNPLFLDWGIDMHRAETRAPGAATGYNPKVITENYLLGARSPDLQPEDLWTNDDPDRFSGRCILGSTPSRVLKERIEEFLQRRLQDRLVMLSEKPDLTTYIDQLIQSWPDAESGDTENRSCLKKLVDSWAVSEDDEQRAYLIELTDWYKMLNSKDHPQVPLGNLPTTPAELSALVKWYQARPLRDGANRAEDPIYATLLAYQKLFDNADVTDAAANEKLRPRAFLAQALSGFNEELIQWKLGLTLPIDEPIGLTPYREFTEDVAKAVDDVTAWATEPTNNFSPIRSGALKLDKLRMLDSFGRVAEVPCDEKVIVPWPYRAPGRPGVAFLPPRLAQPARVTFRWLDAHLDEEDEMVEEVARSPICGWLLPENLSGRLLVFDGDGKPLGALAADKDTKTLEWVRAPGLPRLNPAECEEGRQWLDKHVSSTYYKSATNDADQARLRDLGELGFCITNPRLARVLLYLWATRSPDFLTSFLNTLDDAMANIDPEGATSMGSTALLVGRPVAVVGAELNLVLKDEPAVRQDWAAFLADQYRHRRDTDDFPQVQFRLRLGQYKSRNDGVLGYWREELGGFTADTFVAQAADDDDPGRRLEISTDLPGLNAKINAHDSVDKIDDLNFTQSVAAPPLRTTLLMDPRGRAHLTTGILPVKSIDIPRHLWEPTLEAIRVWFPTAPVLSRPGSRRVPTPTLVDHRWSWLELEKRKDGATTELEKSEKNAEAHVLPTLLRPRPSVEWKALEDQLSTLQVELQIGRPGAQLPDIPHLIEKRWLEEQDHPGNRLDLGSREDRQELDDRALEAALDTLLAQLSLALVSPGDEPDFNSRVEVREGWLLLEPGNGANKK